MIVASCVQKIHIRYSVNHIWNSVPFPRSDTVGHALKTPHHLLEACLSRTVSVLPPWDGMIRRSVQRQVNGVLSIQRGTKLGALAKGIVTYANVRVPTLILVVR